MSTQAKGYTHICDLCDKTVDSHSEKPPRGWTHGDFTAKWGYVCVIWILFCEDCFPNHAERAKQKQSVISWIKTKGLAMVRKHS
jgi:hypothetical protein